MHEIIKNIIKNRHTAYHILKHKNLLDEVILLTRFLPKNTRWLQRYWHIENNIWYIPVCTICNKNEGRFSRIKKKYITCSDKCKNVLIGKKSLLAHDNGMMNTIIQSNLSKFNVSNPAKVKKFVDKAKATCIKKYGVDSYPKTELSKYKHKEKYKIIFAKNLSKDYGLVVFENVLKLVHHVCGKCFEIDRGLYYSRLHRGHDICTECNPLIKYFSVGEKQVVEYIKTLYGGIILENDRNLIYPYELDIFIPDLGIAIEYNGVYYHSFRPDGYHEMKTNMCKNNGVLLIHIWENDWMDTPHIIKSNIKTLLYKWG